MLHVAKLLPKPDGSAFDAYGRIISGTLRPGDEVRAPHCFRPRAQLACISVGLRVLLHAYFLAA